MLIGFRMADNQLFNLSLANGLLIRFVTGIASLLVSLSHLFYLSCIHLSCIHFHQKQHEIFSFSFTYPMVIQMIQLIDMTEENVDWEIICSTFNQTKEQCLREFKFNVKNSKPPANWSPYKHVSVAFTNNTKRIFNKTNLCNVLQVVHLVESFDRSPKNWSLISSNFYLATATFFPTSECKLQFYRLMMNFNLNAEQLVDKFKLQFKKSLEVVETQNTQVAIETVPFVWSEEMVSF